MKRPVAWIFGFACLAAALISQPAPRERVGPLPGGGFLLNSGWRLQPAGKQIPLDAFPMASALSRDGRSLLVLNAGYNPPSLSLIDTASAQVVSTLPLADAWLGLAASPSADVFYVGGGASASVVEVTLEGRALKAGRVFPLVPEAKRTAADFAGDVTLSPDGRLLYVAEVFRNAVAVVNPRSGVVIARYRTGRRPYRILFHPDGSGFFVSHWADGSVGYYDASSGEQLSTIRAGAHPTDLLWRAGGPPAGAEAGALSYAGRIFVAAANTNNVYSIAVSEGKQFTLHESINMAMTPRQPLGMTPSALALSPDAKKLFIACADANAIAVVDVGGEHSEVTGFIPAGWYPTAVRALPSGGLAVLNGKGGGSQPDLKGAGAARLQRGSASWIGAFDDAQLFAWTRIMLAGAAYSEARLDEPNPLPAIRHVIYIVKENRSYDEILGDVKEGNGDAALARFGENVTPNQHKLAREFVLFDNFYANGDADADGINWSIAAIAPDFVQKLFPAALAGRGKRIDIEGSEPASLPPTGYLWTNAGVAGLSIRNFGFMVENAAKAAPGGEQVARVRDPVLAEVTNRSFRGIDPAYPDVERAKAFLAELSGYERAGEPPRLTVMRLGNGRAGTKAAVADNDYALGMIVEGVSRSRFWKDSAIFVLEDAAEGGADHVDSHRSVAFVVSPRARRRTVDSSMYNTVSMLRTIEFLLGLKPMTHFDAGARPMSAALQGEPDLAPYVAEKPRVAP